jgi:hypothetical protein
VKSSPLSKRVIKDHKEGSLQEPKIMKKLSVGYLVDDGYQSEQIYELIEKSKSARYYSIDYLFVQKFDEDNNLSKSKAVRYFQKHGFLKLVARVLLETDLILERHLFVRDPNLKNVFRSHGLDVFKLQKIHVRPLKSKSGLVYRFDEKDLEVIKELKIDVILRGGSGILKDGILNVCKFGVISFHHANNDKIRGGPPGFWEVFNREPSTGFVIQRLLPELDGGDVLLSGSIPTAPTYAQNLAKIYKKSTFFMHKFLERLGETGTLPEIKPKSPYSYRLYRMPSLTNVVFYQIKTFAHLARKVFYRLLGKDYRWGVAYQFAERWQSAVLWRSNIIANPAHRFLADPVVFRRSNLDACFVEDYDFITKRGRISVFKISGDGNKELGVALEEPFHLSYPFIFEVNNELYMCPETSDVREIRLYRCVEFPLKWSPHKVLMKDISAVDSNIFHFGDRWWMLSNVDSADIGEHSSEHVFYSDAFDSEAWQPHAKNPVIFDSERARNGGFFSEGGNCFRVFQRQGFDLYGRSMGIAKIKELTTETYREELVSSIEPHFIPKIIGTHSFSYHNGLLAIDFLKIEQVNAAGASILAVK